MIDQISVFDIRGRKTFSPIRKNQEATISKNITNFSKGIYILRIQSLENGTDLKFIKKIIPFKKEV
jgi:hypothetical protein